MFNILVVCTHNSARSVLAEVLLNHYGTGVLTAYSAGSAPRANQQPHPLGLQVLSKHGHDTRSLHSKSWDGFAAQGAPPIDLVITVCDSAAGEVCPLFMGTPRKVHWGYADPSAGTGNEAEKLAAFHRTYDALARRTLAFMALTRKAQNNADLQAAASAVKGVM